MPLCDRKLLFSKHDFSQGQTMFSTPVPKWSKQLEDGCVKIPYFSDYKTHPPYFKEIWIFNPTKRWKVHISKNYQINIKRGFNNRQLNFKGHDLASNEINEQLEVSQFQIINEIFAKEVTFSESFELIIRDTFLFLVSHFKQPLLPFALRNTAWHSSFDSSKTLNSQWRYRSIYEWLIYINRKC